MSKYGGEWLFQNDELYHHGIKGQRWGVRRSREELGYKDYDRLNSTQKYLTRSHSAYKRAAIKQTEKAAKLKASGKDPSKAIARSKKFMRSAQMYKTMNKKYNSLNEKDRRTINRRENAIEFASGFMLGSIGAAVSTINKDKRLHRYLD